MSNKSIADQAGYVYSSCYDAICVAPNGDLWDVFDGPDGDRVDTVSTEVLQYLDDNYDMPVQTVDGDDWFA